IHDAIDYSDVDAAPKYGARAVDHRFHDGSIIELVNTILVVHPTVKPAERSSHGIRKFGLHDIEQIRQANTDEANAACNNHHPRLSRDLAPAENGFEELRRRNEAAENRE